MYVRKYASGEDTPQAERLSIPENYAGNAFKPREEPPPCHEKEGCEKTAAKCSREEKPFTSPKTEMLPILLSVLLSESKEYEDVATLLLFLLLL